MTCIPLVDRNPGEYPIEALPQGWATAQVVLERRNGETLTRYEILDMRFPEKAATRYLQEPMASIAFRCLGLFLFIFPIYISIYTAVHLIRLPVVTVVHLSSTAFFKQLWTIVRIPFYFIAIECAAFYGIFKPLEGRALIGYYEGGLHDRKNRRADVKYAPDRSFSTECWETLSLKDDPHTRFVALCMQSIGDVTDPNVRRVQIVLPQTPPAA